MTFEIMRKIKKLPTSRTGLGQTAAPTLLVALMLAAAPAGAGILGVDVDVDVDVGGGGGGVGVGASVGVGGTNVDADVGLGGAGVGVDVSIGTGVPGGPTVPGMPGVVKPGVPKVASGAGGFVCAKDGNETAYNGFVVRDRDGAMIGWVHEATVSKSGKLLAMRIQSTGNGCYKLANAGFRISNNEVWANVDGNSFR